MLRWMDHGTSVRHWSVLQFGVWLMAQKASQTSQTLANKLKRLYTRKITHSIASLWKMSLMQRRTTLSLSISLKAVWDAKHCPVCPLIAFPVAPFTFLLEEKKEENVRPNKPSRAETITAKRSFFHVNRLGGEQNEGHHSRNMPI